ncbi:FlgD immunoglobulin-like domain containing protein [Candidatus Nitrososphaera sp. FF02]|uniref:FlgD immunoglobulin-like domain containing protein n=1 Tax=Candidatus Nitrososphaera sp. FF02 TaxID=3398226 RepID=UPI0039EC04E9
MAYAQAPSDIVLELGEDMSIGDAIELAPAIALELSISETLGITDLLEGSADVAESHNRSVGDSISIQDSESVSKTGSTSNNNNGAEVDRSVSDGITLEERIRARERSPEPEPEPVPQPASEERAIGDSIAVEERVFLSGSIVPPSAPQLSVSGGERVFNMDSAGATVITFISSSSGTYRIAIDNDAGERVASLSGQMVAGENNVRWTGNDSEGKPVPDGEYTYYITANNDVGTRTPPSEGDGTIAVSGSPTPKVPPAQADWTAYTIIIAVVAAVGTGAYLFSRRRSRITVYLPYGAAPVIDDIRERYPQAEVQEYLTQGGTEMVKGVSIPEPKGQDREWLDDIITRAKELAGVDSINVSHNGKVRPV